MDQAGVFILFLLVPIVLSIVALAQLSHLRATVSELLARLRKLEGRGEDARPEPPSKPAAVPPPLPSYVTAPPPVASAPVVAPPAKVESTSAPTFNLESLLGVKLFAWIGGLALFLGVVFFVKYAFENNWITPAMRVVAGAIVGAVLIVVSLLKQLRRYRVPAQSLCATGILILYADIYAAHSFYGLISLTVATVLMWVTTGVALLIATGVSAQSVAWLAVVGGFATPSLFGFKAASPVPLLSYIVVLDCAIAAVSASRRWTQLLSAAALGSVVLIFACTGTRFSHYYDSEHICFLVIEGLFLCLCTAVAWQRALDLWTLVAMAIAGLAPLLAFLPGPPASAAWDVSQATLLVNAGLIAFAAIHRKRAEKQQVIASLIFVALAFTALGELVWSQRIFLIRTHNPAQAWLNDDTAADLAASQLQLVILRHVAIFVLFASIPYLVGAKKLWPWLIAAIAGPLHFYFVHRYLTEPVNLIRHDLIWLVPIAFALPYVAGVWYLVRKQNVELASGDSRLTAQAAAIVTFVSFVFPVQFHREWITLGWAIEGLALILLFHWIPNRRLRIFALIVLAAAFVRLALNPAVLHYHPRTHVPIWNWYLYAYGTAALCFFFSARWFGQPRDREFERLAPPFLYSLSGVVLFLLMNIEIADYFSIGPTLTFSFSGDFARDMTYTIAWSLFAFALLILGIARATRPVRLVGIGLLCVSFAKLFLHDLDRLNQLYRIGAFITVAVIAIAASFLYQRFLSPTTRNQSQ